MAFEKIKNFIAPIDEEEDEGEELEYTESETKPVSTYETQQTKVTQIPSDAQMVLFEPRSFEEAEEIGRHLKQRRACVVNLHRLQRDYAQRTIDYGISPLPLLFSTKKSRRPCRNCFLNPPLSVMTAAIQEQERKKSFSFMMRKMTFLILHAFRRRSTSASGRSVTGIFSAP